VSRQLSLPIGIDTNVSLRRAAPRVAKATFRTQPAQSECGRSVNVVEHRGATIPARWRIDEPDRLAKDGHREQPALLECCAFKFLIGRLDFVIGFIRAAIVGSSPFLASVAMQRTDG
jgi:hypothetical protein